ncbi:serine/threonine protein kinase-transforming protein Rmil [Thraustotheca clavata]|uniref:Serine/threonine protein kinase-transforming protein Rmil n=1 Tax=Thraustotheca clavata TaxID=74557 RepID=A0A1V9YW00_9STRA|nr:serine/threonine protein kinase-transforming protein Rmil [Thraustotheca clavata]
MHSDGIAIDICLGMAYIHAQTPPILHRDLKSSNILIHDGIGTTTITGFNFACTCAEVMSMRRTDRWCAPEIVSGSPKYTEKVDMYSFGIVLWEMFTHAIPYGNERGRELLSRIVNDGFRPEFPDTMPEILKDMYTEYISFTCYLVNFCQNIDKIQKTKVNAEAGPYPVILLTDCRCGDLDHIPELNE